MTNPIMTEAQAREEAARIVGTSFKWSQRPTIEHSIAKHLRNNFAPISAIEERDATIARLREALAGLVAVAKRNIYPQPDKPESGWAKLQNAIAALNEGQTP